MKYLPMLTLMIALAGCGGASQQQEQSVENETEMSEADLKAQVMKLHDEVMPKMGELRDTRKKLSALADSVIVSDSAMAAKYSELADNIELANEAMMEWMRNFDPNYAGSPEENEKEYLKRQLEGIESVKKHMNESLEKGKEAL